MNNLLKTLKGGDVRSLGGAGKLVKRVRSQALFNDLFEGLFDTDMVVVSRAADAIEKITRSNPRYLYPHKKSLLGLFAGAELKELKWHLGLLAPRLKLTRSELGTVWETLSRWALDPKEGRIVRVNSLQGLCELLEHSPGLEQDFELTLEVLERENIPSISARIRILRKRRGR